MSNFSSIKKMISIPLLNENYSVCVVNNSEVVFRKGFWSDDSITFKSNKDILPRLLSKLDGRSDWTQILFSLYKEEKKEFKELIENLHKFGLLKNATSNKIHSLCLMSSEDNSLLVSSIRANLSAEKINIVSDPKSAELIILCANHVDLSKLEQFNDLLLKLNKTFLLVLIDGDVAIVGPTVIPQQTACFKCFELRLQSNLSSINTYNKIKNSIFKKNVPLHKINFIASLAVDEIFRILEKDSFTMNSAIFINLNNLDLELNPVYKLPRCPVCGTIGPIDNMFINLPDILRGE